MKDVFRLIEFWHLQWNFCPKRFQDFDNWSLISPIRQTTHPNFSDDKSALQTQEIIISNLFSLSLMECNSMEVYSKLEHLTPHILFHLQCFNYILLLTATSYIRHVFRLCRKGDFFGLGRSFQCLCPIWVQECFSQIKRKCMDEVQQRRHASVVPLRACRVWFLFLDKLKLIPLVFGSDPLFSQQPAGEEYRTLLFFTFVPIKIK